MKPAAGAVRHLPPVLVGGLLVLWLLLNQSVSLGHVVLGLVLAIGVAWAQLRRCGRCSRSCGGRISPACCSRRAARHRALELQRRACRARVARGREVHSGFVKIPLALKDPHGLAVLAGIVTSTPGTVWVSSRPADERADAACARPD